MFFVIVIDSHDSTMYHIQDPETCNHTPRSCIYKQC